MKELLKVWPWVKPYWLYMAGALAGTVLSVGISLLIPLQTARVIDEGIAANDGALVRSTVLFMVALILAGVVVSAITSAMAVRMAFNTITDLRRDLYGHAQHFSFGNLDRLTSGGILTRLTSDMTKVTTILTMGLAFIAQTPLMFVGALIAILSIDASLLIIVLVMIPAIGTLVWYVLARSGVLYNAVQNRLDRLNTVLQENIEGTEAIKAFVRQDFETEQFDEVADDLAHQATIVNQLVAALMPTLIAISSLGIAAVIWLGGNNVIEGDLSEGDLVAFISYMAMVTMPMMMLAFVQPLISAAGASMARIDQVLQELPEVPDAEGGIDLGAQPEPGDIRFENVSFAYRSGDTDDTLDNALTNINLHIRQGTTVAVLGATGSGKSSLVHLIPRFYDTSAGTVYVGGIDVRRLSKDTLRRNVGVALQEPQLFGGTVMENIRYGRPDASDHEVFAAAMAAQAHEFITAMPAGYDSLVEQNGANLSGGQRQRMAIARTLLLGPAILILDDSTSAVDSETEEKIQKALEPLSNQTVILVAQRISTALGADEIVVLDDGNVCAHGSHRDLMESSPVYQEIYRSQLGETVQ